MQPGDRDTWVDYYDEQRAPLLFVSGDADQFMPTKVQQSNAKKYKGEATVTEVRWPHLRPAQNGWEQIAGHALDWALTHAASRTA